LTWSANGNFQIFSRAYREITQAILKWSVFASHDLAHLLIFFRILPQGAVKLPQGDSPYGAADMAGNVWEWTHSLFKSYPYEADDGREDENASGHHVQRGGSFIGTDQLARTASRYRGASGFLDFVGFRVVVAPHIP